MSVVMVRQNYQSNISVGPVFVNVLPKELTIRAGFTARRFDKRGITIFEGVDVMKPRHVLRQDARSALHTKHSVNETVQQYLRRLVDTLKEVIYWKWIPSGDHAIMHSSGIDSRILSWTIKELWNDLGNAWLGKVLFLCSKWEGEEFKKIMSYEGWDKSQYWVVDEDLPDQEYYRWSLTDFNGAWERANGVSAIPVNLFWYPIAKAQERGMLPEKIQTWSGQWGNTVMDETTGDAIKEQLIMFYYSVLRSRPFKGDDVVFPFAEAQYVGCSLSSKHRLGKRLRPMLLEFMDKGLARFTNMQADGDRHRRISDDLIEKMIADYDKSEYGKRIKARPKYKTTEFQDFWSHWTAASLCEHLIEKGHIIKWQTT